MLSANEAMVCLPRLANHHGRMAVVMKRAGSLMINTSLLQIDIGTDYINNIKLTLTSLMKFELI